MNTQRIEATGVTEINLDVSGDLSVTGGDETDIIVARDDDHDDERSVELTDGLLMVTIRGDARIRVPRRLPLRVGRAHGDARLRDLDAGATIGMVEGDLRIEDTQEFATVSSVSGDVTINRLRGSVRCDRARGDLNATEISGELTIGQISGDVRAERVDGRVVISEPIAGDLKLWRIGGGAVVANVAGDLDLSGCQNAEIGDVAGDVAIRQIANHVTIGQVHGDAAFDDCGGPVSCGEIDGDLTARNLRSGLRVNQVRGRAKLSTSFEPGQTYEVTANGNVTIVVDGDIQNASVAFDLRRTDGGRIDVRLPLLDVTQEPGAVRGRLGSGAATVRVEAGGGLRLVASDRAGRSEPFAEGIFDGIGEEIQTAFSAFVSGNDFEFEQRVRDRAERFRQRAEETARRATEKAEEKVREVTQRAAESHERHTRRAAERAQHAAERAARPGERHGWSGWPGQPFGVWPQSPPPPAPAPPARPRATEEERLVVLRMLSEGKISAEDAARLLEALGV